MATKKHINYRELSAELDDILARLQSGELEIEESITRYKRGMEIIKQLQNYLRTAENTVKKVKASHKDSLAR